MPRSNDHAITTAILALASGALLGAATALLLAPASGRETRRKLHDIQEGASNRIREYASSACQKIKKGKGVQQEDLIYDGGDAWI